jgi:hypothetical protein
MMATPPETAWLLRRTARYYKHCNTPRKENDMNTTTVPATRNECWGFWGAMDEHASLAWPLAMRAVAAATGENFDTVRAFLDSRHGRHFADEVHNGLFDRKPLEQAVDAATRKWMGWTIGRTTSSQYGIPRGLPYLTGFVIQSGIDAELEAA